MAKKVSKKSKRRLMTFGIISILAIGYFCFTLFGYIYSFVSLKNEEKALNIELEELKDKKAALKVEMQKLNDPNYVARYAKEKFLYSHEGEFVIKINESNTPAQTKETNSNPLPIVISSLLIFSILVFSFHIINRKKK